MKMASSSSSDPKQWRTVFNSLVTLLKKQHTEVESLAKERKFLADRLQLQCDRWVSDVRILEQQVSQIKREVTEKDLMRALEVAKSDLLVGLKQRECGVYQMKLDGVKDELKDFKSWFGLLTRECSTLDETSWDKSSEFDKEKGVATHSSSTSLKNLYKEERRSKTLEDELKKLKRAFEELKLTSTSEVSALLSERDFVWNQYNKLEGERISDKKSKDEEATQANQKIENLLSRVEELQSTNTEKDETIVNLKTNINKLELDSSKSKREIFRLSKELELLRNSRNAVQLPVLNPCSAEPSSLRGQNMASYSQRLAVKEELGVALPADLSFNIEKESLRSSKRKAVNGKYIKDNPKGSKRQSIVSMPSPKSPSSSKRKAGVSIPSSENPSSLKKKAVEVVHRSSRASSKRKAADIVPSSDNHRSSKRNAVEALSSSENQRTLKRKTVVMDVLPDTDSLGLFTAAFKLPRLKPCSSTAKLPDRT